MYTIYIYFILSFCLLQIAARERQNSRHCRSHHLTVKMIRSSRCLNTVLSSGARQNKHLSANTQRHLSSLISNQQLTQSCVAQIEPNNKRKMSTKVLTLDSMNPNVIKMEYAVRGPLVIRAGEIEKEIKQVSNTLTKYN